MIIVVRQALSFFDQDVAVNVVADVEDFVAGRAERALEIVEVAPFVDPAALEREAGGVGFFSFPFEERAALLEERGLGRRDDDDVEVIAPGRVLGHRVAEEVAHHLVGVRPA